MLVGVVVVSMVAMAVMDVVHMISMSDSFVLTFFRVGVSVIAVL